MKKIKTGLEINWEKVDFEPTTADIHDIELAIWQVMAKKIGSQNVTGVTIGRLFAE